MSIRLLMSRNIQKVFYEYMRNSPEWLKTEIFWVNNVIYLFLLQIWWVYIIWLTVHKKVNNPNKVPTVHSYDYNRFKKDFKRTLYSIFCRASYVPPFYHVPEQEPAGPQVHLMSMSQTTEPSNDAPAVTEGLIHCSFLTNIFCLLVCVG